MNDNITAVIISHEKEATRKLLQKIKFMLEEFPDEIETAYDSVDKIVFPDTNSTIYLGTAGSKSFGRGDTITRLHCSEFAFWPRAEYLFAGLKEAVPENGIITIETTPNGVGNYFYDMWQSAKNPNNEWTNYFYPWYYHYEYMTKEHAQPPFTLEEQALLDKGVKPWQINWRRKKLGVGAGELPSHRVMDIFHQEYPEDDVSCFLQSGSPVFEAKDLVIKSKQEEQKLGKSYVIGVDTAEGVEGGDYDYACVLDEGSGEQVAWIHGKWPPDVYADRLYELGKKYNNARIAVERNNHGHAVILQLKNKKYSNLYVHDDGKYGWHTNAKTKPLMIDKLEQAVREGFISIADEGVLAEMLTFQYNEKGSAEAAVGKHDDRVMAMAIAWFVRSKPKNRIFLNKPKGF